MLTVVIKISSPDDGDFTANQNRSVLFCRVGAFASNWTPRFRNDDSAHFMLGDFIEGIILAPASNEYRFANLCCWRRASVKEWKKFAHSSVFGQGQIELGANSVFNLPILGSSNFNRYANEEENVFTCCVHQPILVKTELEQKSRLKGRLSRLDEDSIFEPGCRSPTPREGHHFRYFWFGGHLI